MPSICALDLSCFIAVVRGPAEDVQGATVASTMLAEQMVAELLGDAEPDIRPRLNREGTAGWTTSFGMLDVYTVFAFSHLSAQYPTCDFELLVGQDGRKGVARLARGALLEARGWAPGADGFNYVAWGTGPDDAPATVYLRDDAVVPLATAELDWTAEWRLWVYEREA